MILGSLGNTFLLVWCVSATPVQRCNTVRLPIYPRGCNKRNMDMMGRKKDRSLTIIIIVIIVIIIIITIIIILINCYKCNNDMHKSKQKLP